MGFRTGSYCKVWQITPKSDVNTQLRVSISKKNKQTGEYEQDFSGFVACIGRTAAKKAAALNEGDRIRLKDVDVSNNYDKTKNITYVNYKCFDFAVDGDPDFLPTQNVVDDPQPVTPVDNGEPEDDSNLPF